MAVLHSSKPAHSVPDKVAEGATNQSSDKQKVRKTVQSENQPALHMDNLQQVKVTITSENIDTARFYTRSTESSHMVLTEAGNMPGQVNRSATAGNTGQTVSTIQKKDVE